MKEEVVTTHFSADELHEDVDLIRRAQQADEADRKLTIKQALRKYPKAIAWSLFLSLALVVRAS
jgi:SP family general alpha glucoside:H+ symporter-like MFS transporter